MVVHSLGDVGVLLFSLVPDGSCSFSRISQLMSPSKHCQLAAGVGNFALGLERSTQVGNFALG